MEYPKQFLNGVFWTFDGTEYISPDEFERALKEYAEDIDVTVPGTERIGLSEIEILLEYVTEDDDDEEFCFLLTADNRNYFTTIELLYKINNKVTKILENQDKHFFEGLSLSEAKNPPLYNLDLGS